MPINDIRVEIKATNIYIVKRWKRMKAQNLSMSNAFFAKEKCRSSGTNDVWVPNLYLISQVLTLHPYREKS